ncbi:hypothetical protein PanWU01x14_286250 [Parasponia andersonii]|uniref:Retrovirus-related Pol polyprotein from transposon TNT 1-94 n=1 Tax=Parasponia andersonii TaxID=3476 RepID=A0A2P5AZA5_PARAD|nr:hypothetical protein PanWU01x14_286250 [Parasponia andersonii]
MDDKEWERINRQACDTIRLCLCREQKYPFMRETFASKLWKAIENKYMKKSNENRLYLKKRLFHIQLKPGTTISDHIDTFNQLIADLLNLDETFKDEDKTMLLIGSFPDELDHLCITLLHGNEKLFFDEVSATLYNHEIRKKDQKENKDVPAEVLTVREHSQRHKQKKKGRSRSKGRPAEVEDDESNFALVSQPMMSQHDE